MGLKFRRRQKLFPGVNLNLSAKGVSATVGIKGLSVNFNKTGAYLNTGIPGTGIYDRNRIAKWEKNKNEVVTENPSQYYFVTKNLESAISSNQANSVTSEGLAEIKENLIEARKEYEEIKVELFQLNAETQKLKKYLSLLKLILVGFFMKSLKEKIEDNENYIEHLTDQLSECNISIETNIDPNTEKQYKVLAESFKNLLTSDYIWNKTKEESNKDSRSSASYNIDRKRTNLCKDKANIIKSDYDAFCFIKANRDKLYLYPAFAMLYNNQNNFEIVELSELEINFTHTKFHESESLPNDTEVIGSVWLKENNDGSPDKRFKNNYQIPIVRYGELTFSSKTGINEVFIFSNAKLAEAFAITFKKYLTTEETTTNKKLDTSHLKFGEVLLEGKKVWKWYDTNDVETELIKENHTDTKQDLYNQLVAKRREYDYNSADIINPSKLPISNDIHLNAWAHWHGNLDADILLIGQDFGDVDYYKKCNGFDDPQNQTNKKLFQLFNQLGIELGESDKPNLNAKLYFTNAVLGAKVGQPSTQQKNGGMATPIKSKDWYSDTATKFIKPLIEIINPKVIITMGTTAYNVISIIYQLDKKSLKELRFYPQLCGYKFNPPLKNKIALLKFSNFL